MKSILIIDDDIEFCMMLRDYLTAHDIYLTMEHDGDAGLAAVRGCALDMILLDVMLPGIDGLEVLSRLKEFSPLSVLLLSAQGSEANRILGLDEGADDYLAKPFNPRELVARIGAILRRSERKPSCILLRAAASPDCALRSAGSAATASWRSPGPRTASAHSAVTPKTAPSL